jgi:branched-chain amino acid transport system substrate-binding protein
MNSSKIFITVLSLLATPFIAGCAEDGGNGDGTGGDETLNMKMGTLMPLTGALSNLGPSMQNGAKLAIQEINDNDRGLRIEAFHEDDRTTDTSQITNTFNLLVSRGVTAIAGPCCSGITGSILDLAKQNEVVVASPSATSPTLTEGDNQGYFFRVPPTDAGQGVVLADLVADENVTTANMIIINNDYGTGLAEIFKNHFTTSLSGVVPVTAAFDEGATEFSSQVTQACAGAGTTIQAIVLVAYTDDAAAILKAMQAQDCLGKVKLFASEGVYDAAGSVAERAGNGPDGKSLAEGMMGTTPQPATQDWTTMYRAVYNEDPLTYAAESYDAVMYLALAALKAGSVEGSAFKAELLNIANAPGTQCSGWVECAELINDGQDIDYVGQAHDLEFTEKQEPRTGAYAYWKIEDGTPMFTRENVQAE